MNPTLELSRHQPGLPPGSPHPDAPPPGTPTKVLIAGVLLFGGSSLYFTVLLVVGAVMGGRS